MGDNYKGPARHIKTLKDVLEATTSEKVRTWAMQELDYLYDVASGMLAGAKEGELLQLQNSIREIVARKSDKRELKWKVLVAVSATAALGTFGLRLSDQAKIQSVQDRLDSLETPEHVHMLTPSPLPDTPSTAPDPLKGMSANPTKK